MLNGQSVRSALSHSSSWPLAVVMLSVSAATTGIPAAATGEMLAGAVMAVTNLSGWLAWTAILTFLGDWAFGADRRTASLWAVSRVFAMAQGAGALRVLDVVGLGPVPALLAMAWQAAVMAVALREIYGFRGLSQPVAILAVGLVPWLAVQIGIALLALPTQP